MLGLELFLTVLLPFKNHYPLLLFSSFLCFLFSSKALQNGDFRYFQRMKRERKVVERGEGWFFYFEIKIVAAVLIKSSVYAGFKMYCRIVYFHSNQIFFLLVCKCPPLFWFVFWTIFISKPWIQGISEGLVKIKNVGKEEEDVRAAGFFRRGNC